MIMHSIHNLRTADWRRMDREQLRVYLRDTSHQVVRWKVNGDCCRSYLVMTEDGGLFAIFFRRV